MHAHLEGAELPVLGRAARALAAWLAAAGLTEGPLFRPLSWHGRHGAGLSDRSVAEIVKTRAALAGYDPREFGGHSLRSGFVTAAGRQGVSLGDAMASPATAAPRWPCATTRPAPR